MPKQNEIHREHVEKVLFHTCHISIWNICKRAINSVHISQSTTFQSRPLETQNSFFIHLFWPRKQTRIFELSPNYFILAFVSNQSKINTRVWLAEPLVCVFGVFTFNKSILNQKASLTLLWAKRSSQGQMRAL